MTTDQIELNMAVMTPKGKGVVVGWEVESMWLVKLEKGGTHNGYGFRLIAGSTETLDNDGRWFSAEDLTAVEEPMTEQTQYPDWQKLTPLPHEPRPDEKIGAKFVIVDEEYRSYFKLGDIVELVENDKTTNPYFKLIGKLDESCCFFQSLAPLPQEKAVDKISKAIEPYGIESTGITADQFIETAKKATSLTYKEVKRLDENVRSHNVGSSDYAKHKIQPWDVWLDHHLNPWEGDIVKRVIRRKKGQNRREDFEKIIHIAQELIRQIDMGEYVDYKLMAEDNKELKKRIEELENENKNNNH